VSGLIENGQQQLQGGKVSLQESFEALAAGEDEQAGDGLHGSPIFLKAFSQNVLHHRLMYKTRDVSGKLAESFGNWLKGRKQRVAVKT
jgi:hypothetical protein